MCENCRERPKRSVHSNTKYCERCRLNFLTRPKSSLSHEQIREAKKLIGKMPGREIAAHIGCSLPNLKRAFRGVRLAYYNKYVINPTLVKTVCKYYEKHGRAATEKRFPGVKVRSIVEKYKLFKPRQVRWKDDELIALTKMAGLVSFTEIAKYFNRPNAHEGSIRSVWMKRFGFGGGGIHGMSYWMGRHLVTKRCPIVETNFWNTRRMDQRFGRKLYLWVDMEEHLRENTPQLIEEAVRSMASFQRWLFQSDTPKRKIMSIIRKGGLYD